MEKRKEGIREESGLVDELLNHLVSTYVGHQESYAGTELRHEMLSESRTYNIFI